jgi:hypothetical protein
VDGVCCNFLRVHYRDLEERVKQGGTMKKFWNGVEKDVASTKGLLSERCASNQW